MAYLIIGVVILVVLVPIFSVLPSARQRQQMKMRQAARAAGVSVEIIMIDDPNPEQEKYVSHTGRKIPPRLQVAAYRIQRRRNQDWRRWPDISWCLQRQLDGSWFWKSDSELMSDTLKKVLDDALDVLPEDVEQVEESDYNISVYWHERAAGSEDNVLNFLRNCAASPLHEPPTEDGLEHGN